MVRRRSIIFSTGVFRKVITSVFFMLCVLSVHSSEKNDSLRFEVLMSSKILNDIHFDKKFINSLEITPSRLILLSTIDRFYLLGWGGIEPVGKKNKGNISSYAFTPDGFLMIVRNKELCYMDSLGNLSKLFGLPSKAMGISAGEYVMYVYDRDKNKKKYALYLIAQGGKYSKLFEVTTPINSVVEMNNSLLFATRSALFSYSLKSKELKALVALPKGKEIKSIAVDSSNNRIYFSTENTIYAIKDSSAVIITDKFGGIIRFFNDGLIVFKPEKKYLIRIVGIENEIASEMQALKEAANDKQTSGTLTNESIINLVKAKLSDDLIMNMINSSEVNFNVSVDSIIFLSKKNVSSAVITAMKNAMDKKTGNAPNGSNHK